MENEGRIQIDITIRKICTTCHTETVLRHANNLFTVGEHTKIEFNIDADQALPCPNCGSPLRLYIHAQPYELVNHLDDSPVARYLYEQGHR